MSETQDVVAEAARASKNLRAQTLGFRRLVRCAGWTVARSSWRYHALGAAYQDWVEAIDALARSQPKRGVA